MHSRAGLAAMEEDLPPRNPDPAPRTPGKGAVRLTSRPRRVLVVEDDLDSVHALAYLVRSFGHQVEYAINGYVVLDIAARFRPDVVLLDLGLPGMDGYEVCRRLKHDPQHAATHVIVVTAYSHEEHRAKARAAGCDLYLVKPVAPQALFALLEAPSASA
jgi:DNA-binding response OmpR family regulator